MRQVEGKVVHARNGKLTLIGADGNSPCTYEVASDALVRCDGHEYALSELEGCESGAQVRIDVERMWSGKDMITGIEALPAN